MCTVTAVRHPADASGLAPQSLRIVINRDELRARPESLDPICRFTGDRRSIMPIDPVSGGTWIGCNDAGLAAVILNMAPGATPHSPRAGDLSRGLIIPALLNASSIAEATDFALALPAQKYPPFRLLLATIEHFTLLAARRDHVISIGSGPLMRPLMLASSGLGDDIVQPHRAELFARFLKPAAPYLGPFDQDRFHLTPYPEAPEIGVLMHRADARTVSITTLSLNASSASIVHRRIVNLRELPSASAHLSLLIPATEIRS